ncbi:MAG: HNH endonuclease [Acidobacteriota bacterium]|nr:HNH endonuclease [Acidobacteriota bacterium]
MSNRPTAAQREEVFKRAQGVCEYCRSQENYSISMFEVEHILPISKKGETILENLAFACSGCNKYKSDRISSFDAPSQAEIEFYNPRKDDWHEHFIWNTGSTEIIGKTAKGRVTIKLLKLNRKNLINLRSVLVIVSDHPPNKK